MSEDIIQQGAAPEASETVEAVAVKVPAQRVPRFKKKVCRFCHNKDIVIDYKKTETLERFITDRGKILPRRITGTCAKHQRALAQEIKRARMIALLPFVEM
ncbi:MAG: 30S ribosomal protein S18 [Spirochaetota bacterium]